MVLYQFKLKINSPMAMLGFTLLFSVEVSQGWYFYLFFDRFTMLVLIDSYCRKINCEPLFKHFCLLSDYSKIIFTWNS